MLLCYYVIMLSLHGLGDAPPAEPERRAAVSAETWPVSALTACVIVRFCFRQRQSCRLP